MRTYNYTSGRKYTIQSSVVCDGTLLFLAELEQYVLDYVDGFALSKNKQIYKTNKRVTSEIIEPPHKDKPWLNCKFKYEVDFILY